VLVVGAGIGGMQAALDLAEAGLKVYLLEQSPAIGGIMAQLDKTFPTNDCAMCIMSPKLVEVGRHLNIEILTTAEVAGIEGEPGNFRVSVRRHPRYVDIEACTGCGDCAAVCPIHRPDAFNGNLSERRAIYKPYPQAIPNAYAIEKAGTAPCRDACPISQRAQGYVALVREGRYADAYRTIKEENPFPAICGRVCNHRCEDACSRGQADEPVNIMGLKRFVTDWARDQRLETGDWGLEQPEASGKKVAVVGAGPAGLTCALDLVRQGHAVSVYEALPVAGGMMRVGVPAFRLPHDVIQQEVDEILAEGVALHLNHRVDDIPGLLDEFDAVFAATGAHQGVKLPLPGAELPGVLLATDFLRDVALEEVRDGRLEIEDENQSPIASVADLQSLISDRKVLVLGGGNVATDTAMTALRLGASWVGMSCLECREEMPAHEWEIADAVEEGIELFPSRTFKEIVAAEGRPAGVRCSEIEFHGFRDGRPEFDEIPGSEETIAADVVIFAIGQRPELAALHDKVETKGGRFPAVNPETLATTVPGLFAGGDLLTGTAFIVDAIAAGHKAAQAIHRYLDEKDTIRLPLAGKHGNGNGHTADGKQTPVATLDDLEVQRRLAAGEASSSGRHTFRKRPAAERRHDFAEIALGLSETEARTEAERCLECGICAECLQCAYACQAGAIRHEQQEETVTVQVGAVVLAAGVEPLPGNIRPEFGYGHYPNVVTSLEFERMLSASGPFAGVVKRPSDGNHPRKVAWIQCVGSRDCSLDQGYCSSVCCMYATKEAVIAREHDSRIEPTIFYMDVRAFGKGFEGYITRAESEQGVRYVRSMVSSVKEVPGSRNLRLQYATFDAGGRPVTHEEEFEMVVLSVGLKPSTLAQQTAQRLGVDLNEYGFAAPPHFRPATTSRPGIYVAGAFAEPKDIPETVVEASCAAAQASSLLARGRGTLTRTREYPPERDVREEEPRVGVFICHCGINIGGVVDVPAVVEHAKMIPGVVYAERNLYTCSQDTQEKITATVREQGLNRVVVASCTPRTHEPLFQDTIRQAGLNPHLFELANIREQAAWVHRDEPETATEKAKSLVSMAVAKARRLRPLTRNSFELAQEALVIGGGLAGMTAALSIADQGYPVTLVEREGELGGHLRHVRIGFDDSDPQQLLQEMTTRLAEHPRITLLLETEVKQIGGYVGQYRTRLRSRSGEESEIAHGAVVVATGAQEKETDAYGYGRLADVVTQREFEEKLAGNGHGLPEKVVMIQCVGSRNEEHPYCSRICCSQALKNALALKQQAPQAQVAILYRDIRTYGFREHLYREARQAGVLFIQFDPERPPQVEAASGNLLVTVDAQPEDERLALNADQVVLSTGIAASPENEQLSQLLKLPLNEDGFFMEAHVKLRPVDFAADGVYLCGLAHSPRSLDETLAQAQAAAMRAVTLLSQKALMATPITATVNPRRCAACGICVEVCPYGARVLEPGMTHAEVVEVLCQGCGACVVACPNKASQQKGFEFGQIGSMIDAALMEVGN